MKKLICLLSLLSAPCLLANTTLDVVFTVTHNETSKGSHQTLDLDENNKGTFIMDDFTITIEQRILDEEQVGLDVSIAEHDEIISRPSLVAEWNKAALVSIGSSSGYTYSLSITAHKN